MATSTSSWRTGRETTAILSNNGSGGFAAPQHLDVGDGPTDAAVADLNGDATGDLVTVNSHGDDVAVLLNRAVPMGVGPPAPSGGRIGLSSPFPNPTRRGFSTVIELPATARVRLDVHDVHGRVWEVLWEGPLTAGKHTIRWDGLDPRQDRAPAGLYFVRLSVSGAIAQRAPVVLLR